MARIVALVTSVSLFVAIGVSWYLWHVNLPLISPLDVISTFAPNVPFVQRPKKVVYGFLPYWNMKYSDQIPIRNLTHLAYFGVDLNEDGTIKKFEKPGELEPGLNKLDSNEFSILHRQLKLTGRKSILTVRAFDPDQIESILNSSRNSQTAIQQIMALIKAKQFDGINVDFEYVGNPDATTKANFTKFVDTLSWTCRIQVPGCDMSIDSFADAAVKDRLWDLEALAKSVDWIVLMTYDYYRPSSNQAGPVAPLRGACYGTKTPNCLEYDVTNSIVDALKKVPSEKVLMGIPFYGYEWQTAGENYLANTYDDTGATATYKRIQELLAAPDQVATLSTYWSDLSMSPYLVYKENGATYQIHYEDSRSLKLKLELVNQAQLGGIAVWALGYEQPYQELWQVINTKITR